MIKMKALGAAIILAAVVATPAPRTVVYTDPAPATATTTVYTR